MATVADPPVEAAEIPVVEAEPHLPDTLYEVIDGRIVEKPMGVFEQQTASNLSGYLVTFVREHGLGWAQAEMMFLIDPARKLRLRPDASFVSRERWPMGKRVPRTWAWDVIPDLVVEVISPTDAAVDLVRKTLDYQRAGVRLVWHVYPVQEVVHVFESPAVARVLYRADALDGGEVVPGFRLPLADLFGDDQEEPATDPQVSAP